ncbi:AEC family transporter [Peteryoungia desertarenae]|uniref:AEC family transporter n=1 Tax=Peteryoungia desertarenae TaxID=1813451 RepID=A0ABX6QPK6_9HYPH|nr:AEC family transporter [Peteryoungia desertarenae]QLF70434.1 AEC family transporter [Peteryoungia desertarenae]
MADIVALVMPFFGMILLGYVSGRLGKLSADALGWLNFLIIYIALPALFFKLVSRTPIEQLTRIDFIAAALAATYSIFVFVFLIGRFIRGSNIPESTLQSLAACYGNIGYMGPGLALLAFGEEAAVPVALVFCFENAMHFIAAPALMAFAGGDKRPPLILAWDVIRKIITHPFIIATAVGFAAAAIEFQPPLALQRLIDNFAQAAAPCALFAMGVTLALRPLKRIPVEISYIVPIKLVLHPILVYVVLSFVGDFDPLWVYVAVLLASLPTATNVFVIGQQYGVWQERASATIMITTVLSVLSVSLVLYAIKSGLLPPDLFP